MYRKSATHQISSFDDPLLRTLKIGVHLIGDDYANSPPAHFLSTKGIVENVVGYSIYGDYGEDSPPGKIITAVATREIDVAIVWGPIAGYFAKQQAEAMSVIPVPPGASSPSLPFSYNIAVGVRRGNDALKMQLTELLQRKAPEIATDIVGLWSTDRAGVGHEGEKKNQKAKGKSQKSKIEKALGFGLWALGDKEESSSPAPSSQPPDPRSGS